MAKKIKKIQIARHIVQLIMFILLPGLYTLTFSEVKNVYKMIASGNFHFIRAIPALSEFIIVMLLTVLMGRFFCGWFCAFGTYNDWIHLISKHVFKIKFKVNERVDSVLKYVKYVILLMLLIVTCTLGSNILEGTSPWDAFAQITDFKTVMTTLTIGLILLVLITIGALFVERFFCRYLCPLGAVFSIVSKISILKINKPTEKCGKCRACTSVCSMGIPLYKKESVKGGECIECLKCIEICPRKNTTVNIAGEDLNPALASSVAIATFAGVYGITNLTSAVLTKAGISSASSITSGTNANSTKYKDGTYTGSGTGFRGGTTTVSVTIKNGQITNIETVSSEDTPNFYNRASGTVINNIISSQSTSVDTVSGATFSSNGIISAVQDALNKAQGTSSSSNEDSQSSSDENSVNQDSNGTSALSDSNSNSNNQSAAGTKEDSQNSDSKNNTAEDENSQATQNSQTNNGTTNSSSNNSSKSNNGSASSSTTSVKYKDGTYTGTGTGFRRGTTEMSVTIKDGKIAKVETVSSQDTPNYYNYAESTITSEIVLAQATNVDTVSGATFSSRGIIEAVQNALSKAK
ncbi:FMN-binding protein [Clostridium manihotivorum]|uniref:Ferredoxin n=1 Tax=Clostridium manihotivorum TaxID=2320868 RepID=A0A3R5V5X9_9CLOT|nr:FMN-binding protein [Clostridium manihotivorum]QAA30928.1 ferredoxin [Clostridium manihotivorum]